MPRTIATNPPRRRTAPPGHPGEQQHGSSASNEVGRPGGRPPPAPRQSASVALGISGPFGHLTQLMSNGPANDRYFLLIRSAPIRGTVVVPTHHPTGHRVL